MAQIGIGGPGNCGPGQKTDPETGRCVDKPPPGQCNPGYTLLLPGGTCVPAEKGDPEWPRSPNNPANWPPGAVAKNPDGSCPDGYVCVSSRSKSTGPEDDTTAKGDQGCLEFGPQSAYCVPSSGSNSGSSGNGECCSEASLCDGLTDILEQIVKTQKDIAKILADGWGDCDKLLTKCEDELTEFIERKIDIELKKFAKCQTQAAAGLCGTAEYQKECAKYALECAGQECYKEGIGNVEGHCKGCGKEPCCCNEGKCEPCDEEPSQPKGYIGWCDSVTGLVFVTRKDGDPPTQFSRPVATSDTEEVAFQEAQQYCKSGSPIVLPPTGIPDIPSTAVTTGCNLGGYADGSNLARLRQAADANSFYVGMARTNEAIGNIGLAGLTIDSIGDIAQGVLQAVFAMPPEMTQQYIMTANRLLGCESQGMLDALTSYSGFGIIQKMTGINLTELTSPYMYAMQSYCRNKFADPDKAMASYLANAISDKDLDTHWAIHGYCPESVNWYKEAARAKPIPLELAAMKLRKIIPEAEYYAGMRRLGYTNQADSKNLLALRQQLPTMSDIIRFMVRDADDTTLVKKFNLDSNFTQKYQKQLEDWSEQQGVPEVMARYAWRAHWEIPSPTQLFQFWRRLRKDQKFGGEAKLWDDIETALIQQDILPYWHEHYKAVNYLPLGRVDIRRSFNIGTVAEADLDGLYQQLGYSDADADRLKKFAIRDRNAAIVRHPIVKLWTEALIDRAQAKQRLMALSYPDKAVDDALDLAQYNFDNSLIAASFVRGALTRQEFIAKLGDLGVSAAVADSIATKLGFKKSPGISLRQYMAGVIDRQTAYDAMTAQGVTDSIASNVLVDADTEFQMSQVMACQQAIRRRFVSGEIDKMGAENALVNSGTVQARAAKLVDGWACQLAAKGKNAAIPKLCGWLARGAISPQGFLDRTKRLGYDPDESAMIMDDCLISVNAKRNAEAKRQAKEAAAESAAAQRRTEQALAKAAQAAAALDRAQKQRQTTIERREKQLLSAADKVIKKCNCELSKAYAWARDTYRRIQSQFALTKDESLQAMITASDGWDGGSFDDLNESVDLAASLLQVVEPDMEDVLT